MTEKKLMFDLLYRLRVSLFVSGAILASVLVRADDSPDLRLTGKKIAVVDGYASPEVLHGAYPDSQIIIAPSLASGLEALQEGDVEAFIGNELIVRSYNALRPYIGLRVAGVSALPVSDFRLTVTDFLPPFWARKEAPMRRRLSEASAPNCRARSPSGISTLMTSAPSSAS